MTMILEADKFVIMMDKEDKKPIMILVMIMELETLMHMGLLISNCRNRCRKCIYSGNGNN